MLDWQKDLKTKAAKLPTGAIRLVLEEIANASPSSVANTSELADFLSKRAKSNYALSKALANRKVVAQAEKVLFYSQGRDLAPGVGKAADIHESQTRKPAWKSWPVQALYEVLPPKARREDVEKLLLAYAADPKEHRLRDVLSNPATLRTTARMLRSMDRTGGSVKWKGAIDYLESRAKELVTARTTPAEVTTFWNSLSDPRREAAAKKLMGTDVPLQLRMAGTGDTIEEIVGSNLAGAKRLALLVADPEIRTKYPKFVQSAYKFLSLPGVRDLVPQQLRQVPTPRKPDTRIPGTKAEATKASDPGDPNAGLYTRLRREYGARKNLDAGKTLVPMKWSKHVGETLEDLLVYGGRKNREKAKRSERSGVTFRIPEADLKSARNYLYNLYESAEVRDSYPAFLAKLDIFLTTRDMMDEARKYYTDHDTLSPEDLKAEGYADAYYPRGGSRFRYHRRERDTSGGFAVHDAWDESSRIPYMETSPTDWLWDKPGEVPSQPQTPNTTSGWVVPPRKTSGAETRARIRGLDYRRRRREYDPEAQAQKDLIEFDPSIRSSRTTFSQFTRRLKVWTKKSNVIAFPPGTRKEDVVRPGTNYSWETRTNAEGVEYPVVVTREVEPRRPRWNKSKRKWESVKGQPYAPLLRILRASYDEHLAHKLAKDPLFPTTPGEELPGFNAPAVVPKPDWSFHKSEAWNRYSTLESRMQKAFDPRSGIRDLLQQNSSPDQLAASYAAAMAGKDEDVPTPKGRRRTSQSDKFAEAEEILKTSFSWKVLQAPDRETLKDIWREVHEIIPVPVLEGLQKLNLPDQMEDSQFEVTFDGTTYKAHTWRELFMHKWNALANPNVTTP